MLRHAFGALLALLMVLFSAATGWLLTWIGIALVLLVCSTGVLGEPRLVTMGRLNALADIGVALGGAAGIAWARAMLRH